MSKLESLQAMIPVFLARRQGADTNNEDYDTAIAQNENAVNQDFSILYNGLAELQAIVNAHTDAIAAQTSAKQTTGGE